MRLIGTAASGIRAQQQAMDTVADNIANTNTIGFKASQVNFAETLKNVVRPENAKLPIGASVPDALSVGAGVVLNGVGTDFSQGPISTTENVWDLNIAGEGFFQINRSDGGTAYTRAGSFRKNASGQLQDRQGNLIAVRIPQQTTELSVDQAGKITGTYMGKQRVFGHVLPSLDNQVAYPPVGPYSIDNTGRLVDTDGGIPATAILVPQEATEISVSSDGEITGVSQGISQSFGQMTLAGFANNEGLFKIGDSLFASSESSGDAIIGLPGQSLGTVHSNALEQSNVNLGSAMTDLIQVQRAYQLNSRLVQNGDQMWGIANTIRR